MNKDFLLIDKPAGWTSFDVVAKIRGIIRRKYLDKGIKPTKAQLKVGHTGTLDPFATGLLIILLGKETKKSNEYLKLDKVYEAEITLGKSSSTADPTGEIISVSNTIPTLDDIQSAVNDYIGVITQTPPTYSAIKINGTRAYLLARSGQNVDMPKRQVNVYDIKILDYSYPKLTISTYVSSGTYIRSLAVDIGEKLGTGAYCSSLKRTKIANWNLKDAETIENLNLEI